MLSKQEGQKLIISKFGHKFSEKINADLLRYTKQWDIEIFELVDELSVNCIFKGKSRTHGDVILKICNNPHHIYGIITETNTLIEYDRNEDCQRKFCRILEYDIENAVMLLECINPGTQLMHKPLENRLEIFISLFKGLHKMPQNPKLFPTYMQWVDNAFENLNHIENCKDIRKHMKKAREICMNIIAIYPQNFLLHGDLHFKNILECENGKYKMIDPKGVLGHPLFDLPRYLLNEYWLIKHPHSKLSLAQQKEIINKIIYCFETALQIPQDIIKQSFFIETALANAWKAEIGKEPRIEDIYFAESML
ncbi:MAG: aminoglycoside phosphotransferase family protein [Defluviitaleaceae bacterium]|nr:aminoglycoside phosphotransferase family protein [Defluviitaleaceae bacterium]